MHGGADGSGAPNGEKNGNYKHGRYTKEVAATRQWLRGRGGLRVGRLSFRQIERELHGFFAIVLGNAISKFANGAANSASSNALIVIAPIP